MPVLYFIRHGETDWNREGRLQGQTDIPLNDRGRVQAKAVASHITGKWGIGLPESTIATLPFISSPMARTRETMEILRAGLGMPATDYAHDDRLKEIGFGGWEGKTWPEIRALDPTGAAARDKDKWGYVPPGGENYAMVKDRVADWLDDIKDDALVVAHGGIARVILVLLAKMPKIEAVAADIWQGKILHFNKGNARWIPGPGHH